jgi:hypothetical protein
MRPSPTQACARDEQGAERFVALVECLRREFDAACEVGVVIPC